MPQNHVTFAKRSWELFGIGKASDCPETPISKSRFVTGGSLINSDCRKT